jgi:hypothetical protein
MLAWNQGVHEEIMSRFSKEKYEGVIAKFDWCNCQN